MTDPFDAAAAAGHQLQAQLAAAQQALATEQAKDVTDEATIAAQAATIAQLQAQLAAQPGANLPWPFTGYAPSATDATHLQESGLAAADIQTAMVKTGRRVNTLQLAPGDHPYPPNFDNKLAYVAALRIYCLGLEGAADGTTVLRMLSTPFTPYHQPMNGYKAADIDDTTPNQVVRGVTFTSELRNGQEYNGLQIAGPNALVEYCAFLGYHVGSGHMPPHETGGLTTYHATNLVVRHVLIDCTDPKTGKPVGASPFMANSSDNILCEDVEVRNPVDGSFTNWSNVATPMKTCTYRDVRSLGCVNSFNFEDYAPGAQVLLDGCTFTPKTSGGAHLQAASSIGSGKFLVKAPVVDSLPFRVRLPVKEDGKPNLQQLADISVVDGQGQPIPVVRV